MYVTYSIWPVTTWKANRGYSDDNGGGGVESIGSFRSEADARKAADALCRAEHEALGYPPGDERIEYPRRLEEAQQAWNAFHGPQDPHPVGAGIGECVERDDEEVDFEIRHEALRMAIELCRGHCDPDMVTRTATEFERFLRGKASE